MIIIGLAAFYGLPLTSMIWIAALVYAPMNAKTDRSIIFFEDIEAIEFEAFGAAARDLNRNMI